MSDEYWLRTSTPAKVFCAVEAILGEQGMSRRSGTPNDLSMSRPDAHPSVERYGGQVHLVYEDDALFLTLNLDSNPNSFVNALVRALHARGMTVEIEEA